METLSHKKKILWLCVAFCCLFPCQLMASLGTCPMYPHLCLSSSLLFLFDLSLDQFAELICRVRPEHQREAGILRGCHDEIPAFYFLFRAGVGWYNFCPQIRN